MTRADSPTVSEKSNNASSKRPESKGEPESEGGSGGEEGEEEEYEIEAIVDAKRGHFPGGRIGYLVKWKGYDSSENSWVDEQDAENAGELVQEYWKKHPRKGRASDVKPTKKGRQSTAAAESASEAGRKRGRKSNVAQNSDDAMDEDHDEDAAPVSKRAKSGRGSASTAARRQRASPDDGQPRIGDMGKFTHVQDWEPLVKSVDTIERVNGVDLVVYFTLHSGDQVMEKSSICRQRFPQHLIDFYEDNLKWRTVEGEE